jgi:hypothetical protein
MAGQPLGGLGRLIFLGFTITHFTHTTLGRTTLDEWSARRRDLTTHNKHNTNIHAPGGYFFCLSGFFPIHPFLYCLNPFVLHVTLRSILPSLQQTQHKHPCPRWLFFFGLSGVFSLWSIFVLFKPFRPSCHFTFHATVLTTNTTQTSMSPVGFFFCL